MKARLTILGSAHSLADEEHENTHFVLQAGEHTVLIDCAGSPLVRLKRAGVDPRAITDVVVTHFHPDHVAALPLLLMDLWLLGRKHMLDIYGPIHAIDRLDAMMGLYETERWPGFYPIVFHPLGEVERQPLIESADLRLCSSPVKHLIPTIGLRIENPRTGAGVVISSDTEPCASVMRLAQDCDILIHEATGHGAGHSSAAEAGDVAQSAAAAELVLIHYSPPRAERLLEDAAKHFPGSVRLAEDFMEIEF